VDVTYPEGGERPVPASTLVQGRLLAWFDVHGRTALPWRRTRDPYAILVAEMMLQQTGVERVTPKYEAWLAEFPTLEALAAAPTAALIRAWAGLGYNSRAVRLQEIARRAVSLYGGVLPSTYEGLRALKGIGPYTAGAVLCFAHEQDVAFIDTNIRRVLGRVFHGPEGLVAALSEKEMESLAARVLPSGRAWAWYSALMDLGATVCTDSKPACLVCPLVAECRAAFGAGRVAREGSAVYKPKRSQGPWRGSTRYYRGRIVDVLRALPPGEDIDLDALVADVVAAAAALYASSGKTAPDGGEAALVTLQVEKLAADGLVALRVDEHGVRWASLPS